MEDLVCNWTPKVVVELIRSIAWPVTILIIGMTFRVKIFEFVRLFFSKYIVSELSASVSGVSAKFAKKQSAEVLERASISATSLPKNLTIESIRERHSQSKTEFSEEIYESIQGHLNALNASAEEKIDLLASEISLLQSAIKYFDINKVLFRSQYELFCSLFDKGGVSKEEASKEFDNVKRNNKDALQDWDWIKYIAYPVSAGLVLEENGNYKLTKQGNSYVQFMAKNPQLVDELAKI